MGLFGKKKDEKPANQDAPPKKHKHEYVDGRVRRAPDRTIRVEKVCTGCPASHWEDR